MMTDPIADMLTRIRNAGTAAHRWVDMPTSKLKVQLAQLLKENSFVFDYKVMGEGVEEVLRVYLKYYEGKPVIRHLERVSRPGRRHQLRQPRDRIVDGLYGGRGRRQAFH